MAILGEGLLANTAFCNSTVICEQSPNFCKNGKKKGPIFQCDFLSSVSEALGRIFGSIVAVQQFEVNMIRHLDPQNCIINTELLVSELQKKWWRKFNKRKDDVGNIEKEITDYVENKIFGGEDCFIIEYAIQVKIGEKLVNGQPIADSIDEAADLLLE